jgi:hypothetical protein
MVVWWSEIDGEPKIDVDELMAELVLVSDVVDALSAVLSDKD